MIVVRRVPAEAVRPLRNRVLRPGNVDDVPDYDADPSAVHLAAYDGPEVVGCATVFPDAYDGEPDAWHLRGMAVDPDRGGEGLGRAVLDAAADVARIAAAPLVWANARVSALGFYEAMGWRATSDEFIYGQSQLPHRIMVLDLTGGL